MISHLKNLLQIILHVVWEQREQFLIIWGIVGKYWHAGQTIAYLSHKTRLLSIIFRQKMTPPYLFSFIFLVTWVE